MLDTVEQGFLKNMLVIRYEDLCARPDDIMADVYKYLEIPFFQHNYDLIEQSTEENDTIHGIFGDHKIRNVLSYKDNKPNEVLGEFKVNWIKETYGWYYELFGYEL